MRYPRCSSATRRWLLALGTGLLTVVALVWHHFAAWPLFGPPASGPQSAPPNPDSKSQAPSATAELLRSLDGPVTAAEKPAQPKQGYVGSESCANCHAAIAETYRKHPMYRSAGNVPGEHEVEDFSDAAEIQAKENLRYQVECTNDQVLHHESMVDRGEETIYDIALVVRLFIGSGTRGKSYAVERGGLLFESPVSWYTGKGWDLSPGYQRVNQRFDRSIGDQCMMCHVGRVNTVAGEENTFREPLLLEAAIGCERCHGPGAEHVARWEAGTGDGAGDEDAIVNPADLEPARQESICNQCHLVGRLSLPRYQRTFYDFRPGQLLDDVWTVVVEGSGVREDDVTRVLSTQAVSQVQQMRESACYRGSGGRLGCSSCHDPHWKPEESQQASFYRARCLACHSERGCSKPEAERALPPAENSCVFCHMPRLSAHDVHAAQTDHRVTRLGERIHEGPPSHSPPAELELYDHAEKRLRPWEHARVLGIMAVMWASYCDPLTARHKLGEAETLFTAALPWAPDDVPMLNALAHVLASQGRPAEARQYSQRALAIRPRDQTALAMLAGLGRRSGDSEAALEYGERLLEVNPWLAEEQSRYAEALWDSGQFERAIEHAEAALKLNPAMAASRSWLVNAYRSIGDEAASQRHAEIVGRMN